MRRGGEERRFATRIREKDGIGKNSLESEARLNDKLQGEDERISNIEQRETDLVSIPMREPVRRKKDAAKGGEAATSPE